MMLPTAMIPLTDPLSRRTGLPVGPHRVDPTTRIIRQGEWEVAIARLIRTLAWLVAMVIVVAIILRVVSANPHNAIVSDIHDAGRWLVGPFHNVFSVKDAKLNTVLNWGVAALVYLIVGHLLARLAALATARRRFGRARSVA